MFKKNILLFIPDEDQRVSIVNTLSNVGYRNLMHVNNSKDALRILSTKQADVVICDVELDTLDGWRFARLIRSGAFTADAHTPIIIISSIYSARIAEATSRAFQVNRFIPFDEQHTLPLALEDILNAENSGPIKPTLLVVEDYPDTVDLVKRVLQSRFDIDVATTGKAGLDAWLEKRHDLVLLDVMLPQMSGNDVLKEILAVSPRQSVVMMTARSTPERAGELILAGAVDYISKPFRTEQLRRVCDIAVQRQDFLVSNHEFAQHQEDLFREKELAQITLQSIADGVITTNLEGEIDYMNSAAERLAVTSLDKAKG
ncbi:MAG: response regulator, partial [Gammaproteobacteria bacterium]